MTTYFAYEPSKHWIQRSVVAKSRYNKIKPIFLAVAMACL
jgi:hypothetical protein